MFDFGFSKLFILGVVALIVIGPERLPKVARTLGALYGRLQRYVVQVRSDISREMEAADLGKMKTEFESAARSFQSDVESSVREVDTTMREAEASLEGTLAAAANEPPPPAEASAPAPSPQLELGIEEPVQPASPQRALG